MNREILFRAKRKDNSEWVEGSLISFDVDCGFVYITTPYPYASTLPVRTLICDRLYLVDPETVCQYTGLTDKNGKKIFDRDIVRYTDELINKEKVDEVKYNKTHAAFCRLHKSEMGLQYLFIDEAVANKCEVVGNVFDGGFDGKRAEKN